MDIKVSKLNSGLRGTIETPPDKSISHRSIILSSLAKGSSTINNFLMSDDCLSTINIFKNLGICIDILSNNTVKIISNGCLKQYSGDLNCGNSGTTMRLLSGVLSGQSFNSVLIGDESLSKRPMSRIIEPLSLMGANISSNNFKAPLTILGSNLHEINYILPIASAQVKSAILLAGLNADGVTTVTEKYLSRNHTELMLKAMGANINREKNKIFISKSQLSPVNITIPGDISSAAFFIVAALIIPHSDIIIKNVGMNFTRSGLIDVILNMGGNIQILNKTNVSGEDIADIRVRYSELNSCEINADIIPRLIDELPIIALLASQANGVTIVTDASDLRNKETDRISAIVNEFRKIGIQIEELDDGFIIMGKQMINGGNQLNTYKDHRIAMTLYIAGLIANNECLINDFDWVNISMPNFLELMESLISL